ncbi:MAG: M56 family metallopeptidase [FCB group bacterium]|jgi:beta-lactamase regulating signal transducer with metallopeptidase domain|nr:M56 family metallopeptidase [FCB group bacterium]
MLWWLIQNALGAAVLAGGAALLSQAARLSPPARHALWLVVLVKLLAPPLPLWQCPWETPVAAAASTGAVGPAASVSIMTLLAALWVAGAAAMALFQGARLLGLYIRLRRAREAPAYLRDEAAGLAGQLGVRLPRMAVSSGAGSPLLIGGFRPRLLLPEALLDRLDLAAWRSVLTHEFAHLKRRDHWTGWLELAGACVWWWNPVFWYARRRLRESAEFACDAWVVRTLPEGRRAYAASLITVIDTFAWKPASVAAIGMAAGGKRIFERRLEMILREAVPHRMSAATTLAALVAVLVVIPGMALPTASAVEAAPAPVVIEQQPVTAAPIAPVKSVPATAAVPEKTVEKAVEQPSKPAVAKAKPQPRAKARPSLTVRKRSLRNTQPAPAAPKAHDEAALEATPAPQPVPATPRESVSPLAALKAPLRIELNDDKDSDANGGLQNVRVGGEIRIRYNHYSN